MGDEMRIHIMGCHAATPRTLTNPTSQVLSIRNRMFLIDCGEGTQVQLRKNKVKFSRIEHVFISHLHGDHFFGLPGLISTFRLLGRDKDLHIYGPKGLKKATMAMLNAGTAWAGFGLHFHELASADTERIFEDDKVTVDTIPMDHRVFTNGYLFREKPGDRKLNVEAVNNYGIEHSYFGKIKAGGDITLDDGTILPNEKLSFPPPKPRSYAYCSDTSYNERIIPQIRKAHVLYHDSTFLETEAHLAATTGHSTAKQAASIAQKAGVEHLILGHYSTRYEDLSRFQEEASTIFPVVLLASDGAIFNF